MAFDTTKPMPGDEQHVTLKKILQRLNTDLAGTAPHLASIDESTPALLVRQASSYNMDVAAGVHGDHLSNIHKFGYNNAIPNGSFADVYTYGSTVAVYPWATSAQTLRVRAGGSPSDAQNAAGARTLLVQGLDENFNSVEETLTLAGASASAPTTAKFFRVFRAYVVQEGTYGGSNVGAILIENTSDTDVLAHIPIGIGQTQQTHYTVPAGFTAYISHIDIQVAAGTNKDADVRFFQRPSADVVAAPFGAKRLVVQFVAVQGQAELSFNSYIEIPEKTDLWVEAKGNGAITGVNFTYDMYLRKNV